MSKGRRYLDLVAAMDAADRQEEILDEVGAERFTREDISPLLEEAERRVAEGWFDDVENVQDDVRRAFVDKIGNKELTKTDIDRIASLEPKKAVEALVLAMISGRSLGGKSLKQIAQEAMDESLEEHDEKYHPKGYHEGDTCNKRANYAKGDEADAGVAGNESASEALSEEDSAYLDAVRRGDMTACEKMVREAAKRAMPQTQVMDDDGDPKTVYHGTVREFNVFSKKFTNPESDMGEGFYFTTSDDDVSENYANENGPDLTNRIELLAERIEGDEEIDHEEALARAREQLEVSEPRMIEAFLDVKNPFVLGDGDDDGSTFLEYESEYDEETDDWSEPSGKLVDFVENLKNVLDDYGRSDDVDVWRLLEEATDYGGISAKSLHDKCKELLQYVDDDNGDLVGNEVFREALERTGFDGVIDKTVGSKFGNSRKYGRQMNGVYDDTNHIIAFSPGQIKSADPVTYDDSGNVIPLSKRFDMRNPDIRY